MRTAYTTLLLFAALLLAGCASPPPQSQTNVCRIFREYPKWYWATQDAQKKWGVPISIQMAIIHKESHYHAGAKPPRRKLLGFIPWFRPTSAYGYSQAVDGTWNTYLRGTGRNNASRSDFANATDFVGWFSYRAHVALGISRDNAYDLYLAYHEGLQGYRNRAYRRNYSLLRSAREVRYYASRYHAQLLACQGSLPTKSWWHFW